MLSLSRYTWSKLTRDDISVKTIPIWLHHTVELLRERLETNDTKLLDQTWMGLLWTDTNIFITLIALDLLQILYKAVQ